MPLQFQEYGTLGNEDGRISPEPGAFGAAWTVATSAVIAAKGVSRAFHWANHDNVGNTTRLYYGNAWAASMICHLFGETASAQPIRVLLPATPAPDTVNSAGRCPFFLGPASISSS